MPRRRAAISARLKRTIKKAYVTPGHAVALSAPGRVAKFFGIAPDAAKEILEEIDSYTLHREYKQPKPYNPIYVKRRRELVQADLIDISSLATENDGTRFLLLIIDVMTKFVWLFPIQDKRKGTMKRAMTRWLNEIDVVPKKLVTDQGLEFRNRPVQELLQSRGVEWQAALGTLKAQVAERANKSIQILIFKHLTENETLRYADVLQRLVDTYNKRGHRTLEGMSPEEADKPENERRVRGIFASRYGKMEQYRKTKLPFAVGDIVRIKIEAKKITRDSRAYSQQFKGEMFEIYRINRTLPIATYYLKSLDDGERILGSFYAQEIQRVRGNIYKVERVIRQRRARGGGIEYLVKWKDFSDRHNSWVHQRDFTRRY